eukprot:5789372-Prymnesium_polylepis.1
MLHVSSEADRARTCTTDTRPRPPGRCGGTSLPRDGSALTTQGVRSPDHGHASPRGYLRRPGSIRTASVTRRRPCRARANAAAAAQS